MAPAGNRKAVLRMRCRSQRLDGSPRCAGAGIGALLEAICGVQGQDAAAAALAIRARLAGTTAAAIEDARIGARMIVRTWGMRGTMHLLAAADLPWLLAIFGPIFIARSQRRYRELTVSEATLDRALDALRDLCATKGPVTRAEIVDHLGQAGIVLEGQAAYHLVRRAALARMICLGPDRDGEPTFVLLDAWLGKTPPQPSGADALKELARRYLRAYAPATAADFTTWSGLPQAKANAAWRMLAAEAMTVDVAGEAAWVLQAHAATVSDGESEQPLVRLLPAFDPYLLGYQGRQLAVDPAYAKHIHPGGGVLRPAVLVDGAVVGTWRCHRRSKGMTVTVQPFEALEPAVLHGVEEEAADVGRFYGLRADLRWE